MSPLAVAARLDCVRALYRLMLYLGTFTAVEAAAAEAADASASSGLEGARWAARSTPDPAGSG